MENRIKAIYLINHTLLNNITDHSLRRKYSNYQMGKVNKIIFFANFDNHNSPRFGKTCNL